MKNFSRKNAVKKQFQAAWSDEDLEEDDLLNEQWDGDEWEDDEEDASWVPIKRRQRNSGEGDYGSSRKAHRKGHRSANPYRK